MYSNYLLVDIRNLISTASRHRYGDETLFTMLLRRDVTQMLYRVTITQVFMYLIVCYLVVYHDLKPGESVAFTQCLE